MINVSNVSLSFGEDKLFDNVTVKFTNGNCYGIIGANGAGKSTFLKILAGEIDSTKGDVFYEKGQRISYLKQNHFEYDEYSVLDTVIMGHKELYDIMKEKNEIYMKPDFSEEDGYKAADLEEKFANMNGWEAEADAEKLLNGLQLKETDYSKLMKDLVGDDKVKVLLAQALFGDPDILLLDEPTNHLDFHAIKWLERFIEDFDKTVLVVSHDRHFLNDVCTHILDIDFQKATLYVGNYDFWKESSALATRMMSDDNKKKEDKIKELQEFVARFSANASKSKQATSRKKLLDKITLDDIKPTSRRYPFIALPASRNLGDDVVSVADLKLVEDGETKFENVNFSIHGKDKVYFQSRNEALVTDIFKILAGELEATSGTVKWGITAEKDYFPKDNTHYFEDKSLNLVDWLRQYSGEEQGESYVRGYLGKMLFSHDEPLKKVSVLSGGEKMRMMFSKLMLSESNTIILDQPTNHLDLESITAVNDGLTAFKGSLMFSSHDMSFIETLANKIIEITPVGCVVYEGTFEEFLDNETLQARIDEMYNEN
ncbi:ABC-F family ATP-binding cassette domain-containing protein [Mycoplasma sp. P36-A1]|uniref:ABC-F family ATP-binding cassette domain-containing protein n=1 Tax=Mycoplasma sp. P36-A1 TaxID=3252900 RepID=UPI003C30E97F